MKCFRMSIATLMLLPVWAHANLLWSYSYSGAGVSGSGYLTTANNPDSTGTYSILALTGLENGAAIRSLYPAGQTIVSGGGVFVSDNLLGSGSPQLDFDGFSFATTADQHNIYYTGGTYRDLAGVDCPAATCGDPSHLGTVINFSAQLVPSIDWNFSYSGAGISGSGILTTLATPSGGAYAIEGLTGTQNGFAMNSLLPGGDYTASGGGRLSSDNLLFPADPYLDTFGFTFNADGDLYNIYRIGGTYYDLAGADCPAATCGDANHLGTEISFSASRSIPEPETWTLMMLAVVSFSALRLRGKHHFLAAPGRV